VRNISDIIEQHLKHVLQKSPHGYIEIQRSELAELFQCVPSQINYVINTRFTIEKGYTVESKRGGGGYIRITRTSIESPSKLQQLLTEELIGQSLTQQAGMAIIERLQEEEIITPREAALMKMAISRAVLTLETELRDKIRANLLKHMIAVVLSR
jgi:transcriptional regulator CtsR